MDDWNIPSSSSKFIGWNEAPFTVTFQGTPKRRDVHFIGGKFVECADDCSYCNRGDKASIKYEFECVVRGAEDEGVKIFTMSLKAARTLKKVHEVLGDNFESVPIACSKSGSGYQTEYNFMPANADAVKTPSKEEDDIPF